MTLRNKQGKFRQSYLDRFYGLILLVETVALGLVLHRIGDPVQLPISPKAPPMVITQVFALETATEPRTIEEKIKAKFGKDGDRAYRLVSECENKGLDPKAINNNRNGTKDVGIFQINTVHGYSVEYLQDVDNNLEVAYKIYKNRGWEAWSCAWVIGETPFYAK